MTSAIENGSKKLKELEIQNLHDFNLELNTEDFEIEQMVVDNDRKIKMKRSLKLANIEICELPSE